MKKLIPPIVTLTVVLLLIAGLPHVLKAQSLPNAWRTYDRFDGLEGSWIFTTIQTSDNALWFGTDQGITRYDGVWRSFGADEGLPFGSIRSLLETDAGELLAATTAGVSVWAGDDWEIMGEEQASTLGPVYALLQRPSGDLWAGGANGLFVWLPDAETWSPLAHAPTERVSRLAGDDQGVWLADENQLFYYDGEEWEPISIEVAGEPLAAAIDALMPGRNGGVWIGTGGEGLGFYDGNSVLWHGIETGLPGESILTIWESDDGSVWVGANGGGVGKWYGETWDQLSTANGLAADFVTHVFEDADGIFWFGTVAGVSRYNPTSWKAWQDDIEAPQDLVSTLVIDNEQILWSGTVGGGFFNSDGASWQQLPLGEQDQQITFLESSFVDADGELWLGTNKAGVIHHGLDKTSIYTSAHGLAGDTVAAIGQTHDGTMWFGTFGDGLSRWDGETWQTFTQTDGLGSNYILALLADSESKLWVGTRRGVSMLEDEEWRHFTTADGLAAPEVTDIAEAADGSLWFATWGGGVNRFFEGEWTTYDTANGLLAPGVEAVWAEEENNRVWFGTVSGLSVFDGLTWQNFGAANGVEIGRIYALAQHADGSMFLGTSAGVAAYHPDSTPPRLEVLTVNGRAPTEGRAQITPDERLSIDLLGRDMLTASNELFYLYRLHGHEQDWTHTRNPRVDYPNLPEGEYTFEAIVRDTGMNYSEPIMVSIAVEHEPSMLRLPVVGQVRSEYALLGAALATLFAIIAGYAVWSTAVRYTMRRQAVERRFNPYVAGSPIREANMFYGRQSLLNEIDAALYHNSLMIHGERRIGKTSLLFQIKHRLEMKQDPDYRFLPIFVDLEGTPETEFFLRLMEGVMETLEESISDMPRRDELLYLQLGAGEQYSDRKFRRDLREIIEYLKALYKRNPRLIFLLDEADILNTYDNLTQQQLRRILQDAFAAHVGAVVAGVNISRIWDRVESPWYNMFVDIGINPFDEADAIKLINEPVSGFYDWDEDALQFVWTQSQGKPHRIQQICLDAVNIMLDDKRRRINLSDAKQAYHQVLHAEMH